MPAGSKNILWVYAISILFVVLNLALIMSGIYYLSFLPLLLIIVLMGLFAMDKLLLLTVFLTPLSINLASKDIKLGLSLPTEPIFFGLTLLFLLKVAYDQNYDKRILKHPVTLVIFASLVWILITSVTSEMPVISLKFFIARLWFVIPFYFIAILVFKKSGTMKTFQWMYILPLTFVIFYTLYNHWLHGFDEESANWIVSPFYNDHTAYGAMLAMFFPVLTGFLLQKNYSIGFKIIILLFLGIFCTAIIFSYTRAAWVSLVAAAVLWVLMLMKIRLQGLMLMLAVVSGLLAYSWSDIIILLEKNKQDASENFAEHVQSISNVSSDASNLERLNRWNSAFRMFRERPVVGFGPGTFTFSYAPYQRSNEKTIISTNMADAGNAHSEYISPLTEQGIPGAVIMVVLVLVVTATGIRVTYTNPDKQIRIFAFSVTLGLITYFVHGALNNFLDTDKAAVPFWGFIAMLVAIDLYHTKKGDSKNSAAE